MLITFFSFSLVKDLSRSNTNQLVIFAKMKISTESIIYRYKSGDQAAGYKNET